jgi:CRISPR-associated endonuclease/helicase Cas3
LAPLLADRVAAVEDRISLDEYADAMLDENLVLSLHRDIAAELVPSIGGKWRRMDVRVGNHEPPSFVRVPELMRDYARDLAARIDGMPEADYERLRETLAFAEGRLLSIHPFGDFNGRATRVFLSELLRRLNLPTIDPTPNPGPQTQRYLAALAAADRMDWGPLAMIWRERFDADEYFESSFKILTGYDKPMRWQARLFRDHFISDDLPDSISIPTGLGKTAVMAVWLIALAWQLTNAATRKLPRRLVYVVDRRAVVDQATDFAELLRDRLATPEATELRNALGLFDAELPISTLRGRFVDNREWLKDPACPAIIVGTVDMIGSRLLFEGYGVTRKMRPYHAGLLGVDSLVLLDESHLVPPFEALLETIANGTSEFGPRGDHEFGQHIPPFRFLPLSATGRTRERASFQLEDGDFRNPDDDVVLRRINAHKSLRIHTPAHAKANLAEELAEQAWELTERGTRPVRCLVYCNYRQTAQETQAKLRALIDFATRDRRGKRSSRTICPSAPEIATELFVGARRVHERKTAAKWLETRGFLADAKSERLHPAFLIATSAGEVGVDLDADHMVCDLVAWERMVQRLGRVNRRGDREATVIIVDSSELKPDKEESAGQQELQRRHEIARQLIERLPKVSPELRRGSPAALRDLARNAAANDELMALVKGGSTPAPLRPALTRPLVDAWSMTSLREHTGRPSIVPWLRGWVSDLPHTTVLWRSHLPIRSSKPVDRDELETFFESAAPHASELLEAETYHILDWLMKRAARLSGSGSFATSQPDEGDDKGDEEEVEDVSDAISEASTEYESGDADVVGIPTATPQSVVNPAPGEDGIVGFILSKSGDVIDTLRLCDIPREAIKSADAFVKNQLKEKKKRLEDNLHESILVLSSRFGGLSPEGLLVETEDNAADTADGITPWDEDEGPFRVREVSVDTRVSPRDQSSPPGPQKWLESCRFDLEFTANDEATRWLIVEKFLDISNNEDDRATGPPQSLVEHQSWAEEKALEIARRLGFADAFPQHTRMLAFAARLHDEGKRADIWQRAFRARTDQPYAKTLGPIDFSLLGGYRHEFGSLCYAPDKEDFCKLSPELQDLALHLIAAHHGFARPVIGTQGGEDAPSVLENRAREVALRFARLQRRWGPWGLAWWEALLRAADQQASRANAERNGKQDKGNT